MSKYLIEPINEPDGEGNGWDECDESEATMFRIWDIEADQQVEAFATRAEAERWVRSAP